MCILVAIHNDCGHTSYVTQETSRMCHLGVHASPSKAKRIILSYEVCDKCWGAVPEAVPEAGPEEGEGKSKGKEKEKGEGEGGRRMYLSEKKVAEIERWMEGIERKAVDGEVVLAVGRAKPNEV